MNCNCNCKRMEDVLQIPNGNDFGIALCRDNIAPANPADVTFADIEGLEAYITRSIGAALVEHEVMDNGDLLLHISADNLVCTTYGIEIKGLYNGHNWRWKTSTAFRICDTNCTSSVQGNESFAPEIYYLRDLLSADIIDNGEGETLELITHGAARMDGGEIIITADNVELSPDAEELIITINT